MKSVTLALLLGLAVVAQGKVIELQGQVRSLDPKANLKMSL